MKIIDTKFKGLKIISHRRHSDSRGSLRETDNKHIIFIGHHPIKSYRYHKKEKKRYGKEKNLIELLRWHLG